MKKFQMKGWNVPCLIIFLHLTGCVLAEGTSHCSVFGRQHIHTFDGVLYEFPGDCSYMLAGDCQRRTFSILGDFSHGQRKGVTVFIGEAFELHLSVDGSLSHGAERLPLPYASNSVFAGFELGSVRLWSEEFGFSIRIDPTHNIQLTLTKHHSQRTCGLCGNYNSIPSDDYTAQEGFVTEDPLDFANSWALKGASEPCKRVAPPPQTCNSTGPSAKDQMSRCEALRTSAVFLRCAHLVDVDAFAAVCEADVCHCGGSEDCICQALLEFARTCASRGVVLHDWHIQSQCTPKCPLGMQYSTCSQTCSSSCQTLNIQDVCRDECVDGCSCVVGKVLDGDHCVDVSQCSCQHTGKRYPPGSTISQDCNTCVCRHGSWECTNEQCPGECVVTGQSHFKSFDNKFFTFSGSCQYLLAKDCQTNLFSAIIETVQCADDQDAVCTRSVTLKFHDMANQMIRLKHGGVVSVDGMDVQMPLIKGILRVQRTVLSSVRLIYGNDLQVDWDGRGRVLLRLSPVYAGKTCGLCGNYNGNQGDDFLTAGGLVETRVEGFGNAWKMNAECENMQKQPTDPCSLNPKRVRFAEEACEVLLSAKFEPCHREVNPSPYVKDCRYDVCSCSDGQQGLCTAVSSYAATCSSRGVLINWRSPGYCEMSCPEGQVYEVCGSVCNQTCRSLSLPDSGCTSVCEEGCFCPRGLFVSDEGECVPPEQCSCHYDGEIYQPKDMFADHHSICYCERGSMHCSSSDQPTSVLSDLFFDEPLPSSRERRSLSCETPLQRLECNSMRDVGIECARTCQNLDLECVSQGCISGCACPSGTVRYRTQCIPSDQCPCFHNNLPYAHGQIINVDCNTCVCKGRRWNCTQRVCDGVCHTVGESHYFSFDGLKFSFPGACQYVLAQDYCNGLDGTFRVLVESSCGAAGQRCTKTLTVIYMGGQITMEHGEVKMRRPVMKETDVEIVRSGLYYIVLLGKYISLTWDTGTRIILQINSQYRGRVCGLCGNFDGNQNNDLLSSNNQMEVDPVDFGNSWKVQPSCANAVQLPSPCSTDVVKLVAVEQSCHVLTSALFSNCNSVVDPEPYWEICTHDTCLCSSVGDCACLCDTVAAYAHECSQRGVVVEWRSNDLCPLSCEKLNKDIGQNCEWRFNACGGNCPITCQHPEPLNCPNVCLEGCHAFCPPGQVLDEVLRRCVEPSQCQVCMHNGERISHGKQIILNHDDPHLCQICHCEENTLTCGPCPPPGPSSTLTPTPVYAMTTPFPFSTAMPEDACDRAMDLAFLVDGSSALSEEDFELVKIFILGVVERFRMGSAHTRATMLLFHSGVKSYDMQVQKWIFRKMVRDMHYSGGNVAFMDEAFKYLSVYIYDKNKRKHAGRVAIMLTASTNPRPMRTTQRLLKKKDITVLTIALGPDVNLGQVNDITKATPSSRAYVLSSVGELESRAVEITDYLCTLGMDPETPKKPNTQIPSKTTTTTTTSATTMPITEPIKPHATTIVPTAAVMTAIPSILSPGNTLSPPTVMMHDITFLLEGSDRVGEEGFNQTRDELINVVASLGQEGDHLRITVIQYSLTITVEISRMELQHRELLLHRMRQIHWGGGAQVNTGHAIRSLYESITTEKPDHSPDQMVFLITQSPPTDVIQRPPSSTHMQVYPVGIGPHVHEMDLEPLSFPHAPIMLKTTEQLRSLGPLLVNISRTLKRPVIPTLPPRATLPPSVPCSKPMDVLFLLRTTSVSQFEDLKTFVRSFMKSTKIGHNETRVAVVVYGEKPVEVVSWRDTQNVENLLQIMDRIHSKTDNAPRLGAALRWAVQTSISSTSGGRMGVAKLVVMLVTDRSTDSVQEPSNEALTAGVSVFPVGVGEQYDQTELNTLAGPHAQVNVIRLRNTNDLLTMVTQDHSFIDRLCRVGPPGVCVDDDGKQRQPGETWLLADGCHSLLCNPSGVVTLQSHMINCERMEPPGCHNNLKAIKVHQPCGCSWACPCMCMGSSTNHVVTFGGVAVKLKNACSYLLLRSGGTELVLHSSPCEGSPNQVCLKDLELREGGSSVLLRNDMKVSVDGVVTAVPFRQGAVAVTQIGALLHQLHSETHGFTVTFTPHSNEFTISLDLTMTTNTTGICGSCSDQTDLLLPDGSVAANQDTYLRAWAPGVCVTAVPQPEWCEPGVSEACEVLASPVFARCHALVPPQDYMSMCRTVACHPAAICDLLAVYSSMCQQQGVCTAWRRSDLCPMRCSNTMEYKACHSGCVEHCGGSRPALGDVDGGGYGHRNGTQCWSTPTEGCFCPPDTLLRGDECVSREACSQCVDQHGLTHQFMERWTPDDNPCLLCICLDQQQINCTALPCIHAKPPVCGKCEILLEKKESKCCPEYECVCDTVNCAVAGPPQCENGLSSVLMNPGECAPIYQCVCKREECPAIKPSCPGHKKLSVKQTQCCDSYECMCDCQNSTRVCTPGYITKEMINDCGCVDVTCLPDKVCVVQGVTYQRGSTWEDKCKMCTCTEQTDPATGLHLVQCVDPVCNQICPLGTTYSHSEGTCCGHCRRSSCTEEDLVHGSHLRVVGEQWVSPEAPCVLRECVKVNEEVFIQHTNVSCQLMDTPSCPLGTELQCNTVNSCCPTCHCVPVDACVLNHTLIGVGEKVMVDACTRCMCTGENGNYHLSCRKLSCTPCSEGYILEPVPESCCGRCVASACIIQQPDGQLISVQVNGTREDGCTKQTCSVNDHGELVLETVVTTCPPLDRELCLQHGGTISQIGQSCCEMCTEPPCKRTVGLLNYIMVDDCQSDNKLQISYCEGRCNSKSVYSLEKNRVESECVCCVATGTLPLTVSLQCPNGTHIPHQVLTVTGCDCLPHACPTD